MSSIFLDDLALAQLFLLPPHGDELPATAQPRLLRAQTDSLDTPADQPPGALTGCPANLLFAGFGMRSCPAEADLEKEMRLSR